MATNPRSREELKDIEYRIVDEAWNGGEYDVLEEVVSEQYTGHWFEPGFTDKPGLIEFIRAAREGFPDLEMRVEFMHASEDYVTYGFTLTGTHEAEFMDIPATGRDCVVDGIITHRYSDGMLVEGWAEWDRLGMLQQLGVAPEEPHLVDFLETALNIAKQDVMSRTRRQNA